MLDARQTEIEKYNSVYRNENYRMADVRLRNFGEAIKELPYRNSYLDVSCGRGEMLQYAKSIGFERAKGTEIVSWLIKGDIQEALAWDLPFKNKEFEVVSLFDVIEHILPGDDELVCKELGRVASRAVFIAANNRSSKWEGHELHVNRRPYEEWNSLFEKWFSGKVNWLRDRESSFTNLWRIDLQ